MDEAKKEVVDKLISWIESSKDFVIEQMPDFASQFMKAATIKSWVSISFSFILLIILVTASFYSIRKVLETEKSFDVNIFVSMASFMCPFLSLACIAAIIAEINTLISIYIAPKVYLLVNLKNLLK